VTLALRREFRSLVNRNIFFRSKISVFMKLSSISPSFKPQRLDRIHP
jgi:hypothetical protein